MLFATIDPEHAEAFARAACEQRIVACVNMLPEVRSFYWWDGTLQDDREVVLWMETRADAVSECIEALAELHPYDTPKIIAMPPLAVFEPYRQWCVSQTRPAS